MFIEKQKKKLELVSVLVFFSQSSLSNVMLVASSLGFLSSDAPWDVAGN